MGNKEKLKTVLEPFDNFMSLEIIEQLNEDEARTLLITMTSLKDADIDIQKKLVEEFYNHCHARRLLATGGVDYMKSTLTYLLGEEKMTNVVDKMSDFLDDDTFGFLNQADIGDVVSLLEGECSQLTALVLARINPLLSAKILGQFPVHKGKEVVAKMANLRHYHTEFVSEVQTILYKKLEAINNLPRIDGMSCAVSILNRLDASLSNRILREIEKENAGLAGKLRNRMLDFRIVLRLDDKMLQKVLVKTDKNILAAALKNTTPDVSEKILKNVSQRTREYIKEGSAVLDSLTHNEAEAARRSIIHTIKQMAERGDIILY